MFQYVAPVRNFKSNIIGFFASDPQMVLIAFGTVIVTLLTAFFCIVLPISYAMVAFMVIFFPIALPLGFIFGRIKRAAVLKKMEKEEAQAQQEEEEEKKRRPKKKGKQISQFEMSKHLAKWAKKSELEKSAQAHQLSEEEDDEDDD